MLHRMLCESRCGSTCSVLCSGHCDLSINLGHPRSYHARGQLPGWRIQRSSSKHTVKCMAKKQKRQSKEQQQPIMLPPLHAKVTKQLTPAENVITPVWSTFCGLSVGEWRGQLGAFSPATGEAEPLSLASDGKGVFNMQTVTVEERLCADGVDKISRQVWRANNELVLAEMSGIADKNIHNPDNVEELVCNDGGLVFFDGGSYSSGPASIGSASAFLPHDNEEADMLKQYEHYHPHVDHMTGDASSSHLPVSTAAQHQNVSDYADDADNDEGDDLDDDEGDDADDADYDEGDDADDADADDHEDYDDEGEGEGEFVDGQFDMEELMAVMEEEEAASRCTAFIEHCMLLNGEERVRLQLTLSVAGGADGGELDADVLRVAVLKESWEGEVGGWMSGSMFNKTNTTQIVHQPRFPGSSLPGNWVVFDVWANPVEEKDPLSGEPSHYWLYQSQETEQRWGLKRGDVTEEGGMLLLPGGMALEIRMVDDPEASFSAGVMMGGQVISSGGDDSQSNGNGSGRGSARQQVLMRNRGISITSYYHTKEGHVIGVQRVYNAAGQLHQVTSRTAVPATPNAESSHLNAESSQLSAESCHLSAESSHLSAES